MYIGRELDYQDKPHWAVAGSLVGGSCLTDWSCYSGDSRRRKGDVWWTWSWSSAAAGGSWQGDTEYSGSQSGQRSHCLLSTWECLLRRMRQLVKQIMTYCKYMYIPTCNNTCIILYMNDNNFKISKNSITSWLDTLSGTSQSDTERQYEVDQHVDTLVMWSKHTPSTNLLQGKLVLEKRE